MKFKKRDQVKVISSGNGCGTADINKIVTITQIGKYGNGPGYRVIPPIGNSKTGNFGGFIGENTFEHITTWRDKYEQI